VDLPEILNAAPSPVECVAGCGGTDWLTVVGVLLAAAALIFAVLAWRVSSKQLELQETEHRAFLNQINARAGLFAEIHLMEKDEEIQDAEGGTVFRILAIGMRNTGQKAAERVSINVLAPRQVEMYWSGSKGEQRSLQLPAMTPEPLTFEGENIPSHYLDETIGPIGLSDGGVVAYVFLRIPVGEVQALDPASAEPPRVGLPIRVKLSSDDLPEGQRSVTRERTWVFIGPVRGG
jgi:hypothetical protein